MTEPTIICPKCQTEIKLNESRGYIQQRHDENYSSPHREEKLNDAFVVTALLTDKPKIGEDLWPTK